MKLNEVYSKSIKELMGEFELVDMRIYTDNSGTVQKMELDYMPKEETDGSTGVDCGRDIGLGRDDF